MADSDRSYPMDVDNLSTAKQTVGYTFCDGCNQAPFCGIKFYKTGNIVSHIESWPGFPNAPLCSKAYGTLQRLYHPNRLKYPLKRVNPKGARTPDFVRISWDEAYDIIVRHLNRIKNDYGPQAAFFYVGDPKEPRAAVQRLAATYGSVNYGTESSTACRRAAMLAELLTYGFPTLGNLPTPKTGVVLIWGTNPAYSGRPFMCHGQLADAKADGVKFIVVDPRKTPTAATLADIHLRPRPATTAALAAGMMHVIFREGLHDSTFCENWISGIAELRNYVQDFTPDRVEKITGVPAEKIMAAARLYASNGPGGMLLGPQGTTHDLNATNNHRAILMIPAICGYIDIPDGITKPTEPLEGMAPWFDGPPEFSMREKFNEMKSDRLDRKVFPAWAEKFWEVQTNYLVEWVKDGKIKAFLSWGFSTMIWPQTHEYQQAIASLEFSMAVDYFYRPWTHDYVDLVLPAAMNFERLAPFAVFGRQIFGRTPLKPMGECKEDWQIALDIGTRLGYPEIFFNGDVEAACNDILAMWGLTYDDLRKNQETGVTVPPRGPELFKKYETGKMRLDGKVGFATPSGKIEAVSLVLKKHGYPALCEYKEPMATTRKYPLILISGSRVPYITHSKWRQDSPWLFELQRQALLTINPQDAVNRNIEKNDAVILKTPWGQMTVTAKPTILMPAGIVGVEHGWQDANVNELIPRQFDPISGFPPFKEMICEVVKAKPGQGGTQND
jgi:anaerobic selenocysteine-containing dehydrogenase